MTGSHANTRVDACEGTSAHTHQHAHRDYIGYPAYVSRFLFGDEMRDTSAEASIRHTHVHVNTAADREFIFYGELVGALKKKQNLQHFEDYEADTTNTYTATVL